MRWSRSGVGCLHFRRNPTGEFPLFQRAPTGGPAPEICWSTFRRLRLVRFEDCRKPLLQTCYARSGLAARLGMGPPLFEISTELQIDFSALCRIWLARWQERPTSTTNSSSSSSNTSSDGRPSCARATTAYVPTLRYRPTKTRHSVSMTSAPLDVARGGFSANGQEPEKGPPKVGKSNGHRHRPKVCLAAVHDQPLLYFHAVLGCQLGERTMLPLLGD